MKSVYLLAMTLASAAFAKPCGGRIERLNVTTTSEGNVGQVTATINLVRGRLVEQNGPARWSDNHLGCVEDFATSSFNGTKYLKKGANNTILDDRFDDLPSLRDGPAMQWLISDFTMTTRPRAYGINVDSLIVNFYDPLESTL
jgi:hypothetical protein